MRPEAGATIGLLGTCSSVLGCTRLLACSALGAPSEIKPAPPVLTFVHTIRAFRRGWRLAGVALAPLRRFAQTSPLLAFRQVRICPCRAPGYRLGWRVPMSGPVRPRFGVGLLPCGCRASMWILATASITRMSAVGVSASTGTSGVARPGTHPAKEVDRKRSFPGH